MFLRPPEGQESMLSIMLIVTGFNAASERKSSSPALRLNHPALPGVPQHPASEAGLITAGPGRSGAAQSSEESPVGTASYVLPLSHLRS